MLTIEFLSKAEAEVVDEDERKAYKTRILLLCWK